MAEYFDHHINLLRDFKKAIQNRPPYQVALAELTELDVAFIAALDELCTAESANDNFIEKGQWLTERIISGYNELLPFFSRDLLWFFGGNCLHYMPDNEIRFYQQLDELRYAAESQNRKFSFYEAKAYLAQQSEQN